MIIPMSRFWSRWYSDLVSCTARVIMIDLNHLDTIANSLSDLLPPALYESRGELQTLFKDVLQAGLAKLDLVTREEFEIQRVILLSTREKLETLLHTLVLLEDRLTDQGKN